MSLERVQKYFSMPKYKLISTRPVARSRRRETGGGTIHHVT